MYLVEKQHKSSMAPWNYIIVSIRVQNKFNS